MNGQTFHVLLWPILLRPCRLVGQRYPIFYKYASITGFQGQSDIGCQAISRYRTILKTLIGSVSDALTDAPFLLRQPFEDCLPSAVLTGKQDLL